MVRYENKFIMQGMIRSVKQAKDKTILVLETTKNANNNHNSYTILCFGDCKDFIDGKKKGDYIKVMSRLVGHKVNLESGQKSNQTLIAVKIANAKTKLEEAGFKRDKNVMMVERKDSFVVAGIVSAINHMPEKNLATFYLNVVDEARNKSQTLCFKMFTDRSYFDISSYKKGDNIALAGNGNSKIAQGTNGMIYYENFIIKEISKL